MRLKLFTFLAINLILLRSAFAEVYECDGKWTNRPCSGAVTKSLEEIGSSAEVDEHIKLAREKTSLLHDVRMKALRAREDFDLRYEITPLEKFCLTASTTLEECQKRIKEADAELDQKIASASSLASQKRSLELQEEANRLQEERNRIEKERPNVTVIEENRNVIVVPRDRYLHEHGLRSGYGASVDVRGNVGGANVSVGGFAHEESAAGTHENIIVVPRDLPPNPPAANGPITVHDRSGRTRQIDGVKPGPFAR